MDTHKWHWIILTLDKTTNIYRISLNMTVDMPRKIQCTQHNANQWINIYKINLIVLFLAIFIIYRQVFFQFSTDNKLLWLIEFGLNRIPQLAVLPHASHTSVDTGSQLLPPHRGGLRHLCFEAVCPKHRISYNQTRPVKFLLSVTKNTQGTSGYFTHFLKSVTQCCPPSGTIIRFPVIGWHILSKS